MTYLINDNGASEYMEETVLCLPTLIGQASASTILVAALAILSSQLKVNELTGSLHVSIVSNQSNPGKKIEHFGMFLTSLIINSIVCVWLILALSLISPN